MAIYREMTNTQNTLEASHSLILNLNTIQESMAITQTQEKQMMGRHLNWLVKMKE